MQYYLYCDIYEFGKTVKGLITGFNPTWVGFFPPLILGSKFGNIPDIPDIDPVKSNTEHIPARLFEVINS